jgi:formate C-acetyltransferase
MKPKYFNTDTIVKSLRSSGVSEEDLKDVAFVGCVEQSVPGKTWGWHNAGLVNLGKCLELAMNDGVELLTGKRLGPATGKPEDFKTMDDVWNAFEKQVETATNYLITAVNTVDTAHRTVLPLPYESLLIEDCIAKGKELNQGGARYNFTGIQGIGLATVADSLTAINKLVFEEKKVKLSDYIEAAKTDYANNDELYADIMSAPKFGNDIDEADSIAEKVVTIYCSKVENHKNPRGGIFIPGMYSISAHVPFGQGTIKMDGNKISGPLSDGTSPVQGAIKNGPTGVAKSQAKLDHVRVTNGTLLNVKYLASQLKSPENIERLAAFLKAFMEIGGYHVQINVTDVKELKDAQKNPEKYPYLMVRVAAYVALFNQISKEIQDEIISRSELEL